MAGTTWLFNDGQCECTSLEMNEESDPRAKTDANSSQSSTTTTTLRRNCSLELGGPWLRWTRISGRQGRLHFLPLGEYGSCTRTWRSGELHLIRCLPGQPLILLQARQAQIQPDHLIRLVPLDVSTLPRGFQGYRPIQSFQQAQRIPPRPGPLGRPICRLPRSMDGSNGTYRRQRDARWRNVQMVVGANSSPDPTILWGGGANHQQKPRRLRRHRPRQQGQNTGYAYRTVGL